MDLTGPEALYLASLRGSDRPLSVFARLEFPNEAPDWLESELGSAALRLRKIHSRRDTAWYARAYAAARRWVGLRGTRGDGARGASARSRKFARIAGGFL